jgi:lambda family phage tail tape measure protein
MSENKVEIIISTDSKGVATGINQAKDSLKNLGDSVSQLKQHWVAFAAVAASAAVVVKQAYDVALLSARVETLGAVLGVVGKNIGLTAGEMQGYVDKVKAMGITTQEAQTNVIRMAQAQMDLGKSTDLARLAQDAAVIANTNSSEAFERLVLGIQRGEVEILKTMGLNVSFENSYQKMAASLGKNSQQLTENEKVQARMNVTLETGKTIAGSYEAAMGTAGKQLSSMQRLSEELKLKLGDVLNPALTSVVFEIVQQFKEWDKTLQKMKSDGTLDGVADTLSTGIKMALFDIKNLVTDIWNILEPFGPFITLFGQGLSKSADGWGDIFAAMKPVSKMLGDTVSYAIDLAKLLVQTTALILNTAGAMAGISSWKNVTDVWGDLKATSERLYDKGNKYAATDLGDEVYNSLAEREAAKGKISTGVAESRRNKAEDERDKALQAAYYGNRTANYPKGLPQDKSSKSSVKTEWAKTSRDLATDLSQINVGEFDKKIDDYENKATDLKEKFKAVKGAVQEIDKWLAGMKGNELSKYEKANNEAVLKASTEAAKERYAVMEASEKFITERMKTELEKRIADEEKAGQVEIGKLAGSLAAGNMLEEEYDTRSTAIREASKRRQLEITEDYNRQILEAETSHKLSMLDAAEKDMSISKEDVTRGRIAAQTTLLSAYNTELQRSIENNDTLARLEWQEKIDATNASLTEQNRLLQEQTGTFQGGLIAGLREYAYNMQTAFQSGKQAVQSLTSAMTSGFETFFDYTSEKFLDFRELALSVLNDIYKELVKSMIINPAVGAISKGLGGVLSNLFGGGANPTIDFDTSGGVGGGGSVIPSAKGNIFSASGLEPYLNTIVSKPTIFKFAHGVGMMGENGPEAIVPLGRNASGELGLKSAGAVAPSVQVNVINQTTKEVSAEQGEMKFDGRKMVLDVILKEHNTNPAFREKMRTGRP